VTKREQINYNHRFSNFICIGIGQNFGIGTSLVGYDEEMWRMQFAHLFARLPQPGGSEVTFAAFESNCLM